MSSRTVLQQGRRRFTVGMVFCAGLALAWAFGPGLPVLWGPSASAADKAEGRELFLHEWTVDDPLAQGDGLGPVFNATSCAGCHFQGGIGGAGPKGFNVLSFEVVPTARDPELRLGAVHAAATDPAYRENDRLLRRVFPVIPGGTRVTNGCTTQVADFDPVRTQAVNTTPLFGMGWIDRISGRDHRLQPAAPGGRQRGQGILPRIQHDFRRPRPRAARRPHRQVRLEGAVRHAGRVRGRRLRQRDRPGHAGDGPAAPLVEPRLPRGRSRPRPPPVPRPGRVRRHASASRRSHSRNRSGPRARPSAGKELFHAIGCAVCHTPDLGGVEGVYSDFLLARDRRPPQRASPTAPTGRPAPADRTPAAHGVEDAAALGCRRLRPLLPRRRLAHAARRRPAPRRRCRPGDEGVSRETKADQDAVIAFLGTLKAPPESLKDTK